MSSIHLLLPKEESDDDKDNRKPRDFIFLATTPKVCPILTRHVHFLCADVALLFYKNLTIPRKLFICIFPTPMMISSGLLDHTLLLLQSDVWSERTSDEVNECKIECESVCEKENGCS